MLKPLLTVPTRKQFVKLCFNVQYHNFLHLLSFCAFPLVLNKCFGGLNQTSSIEAQIHWSVHTMNT